MKLNKKVVHCKKESYDVYIGRPSKWGNPFSHKPGIAIWHTKTVEEAIEKYEDYLLGSTNLLKSLPELKGKILGCWCSPGRCHGDILYKYANYYEICEKGKTTGCDFFCSFYTMDLEDESLPWYCSRCGKKKKDVDETI